MAKTRQTQKLIKVLNADPCCDCPPISQFAGNTVTCRTDGIYVPTPSIPAAARFGVSGEDDTAFQNRAFNGMNARTFNVFAMTTLSLQGGVITLTATTDLLAPSLAAATTANILFYDTATGKITRGAATAAGETITASQGITRTSSNLTLEGAISSTRVLTMTSAASISVSSSFNSPILSLNQNSNNTCITATNSGGGNSISSTSGNGNAYFGSGTNVTAYFISNAGTNTGSQNVLRLDRQYSLGPGADGIGCALAMYCKVSNSTNQLCGLINSQFTTATVGSRLSQLELHAVNTGGTQQVIAFFGGGGRINFPQGLGNFVDDAAAAAGSVAINQLYRNGSVVMIRVA